MKLSHTTGLTALAALMAASGLASADVAVKNTYFAPGGVIVKSSDAAGGAICNGFHLVPGVVMDATILYPGPSVTGTAGTGTNMTLISPATSPTATSAGSTSAYVCRAGTYTAATHKWVPALVPTTGLNGATIPFACFADTQSGGAGDGGRVLTTGHYPVATATVTFNLAATNTANGNALSTANVEAVTVGSSTCTYETDATWYAR